MTLGMVLADSKTSATSAVLPIAIASREVRTNPSTRDTMVPEAMMAEALVASERDREASLGSGLACSACGVSVMCFVYGVSQIARPRVWGSSAACGLGKAVLALVRQRNPSVGYQLTLENHWVRVPCRVAWPAPTSEPVHRVSAASCPVRHRRHGTAEESARRGICAASE